MSDTFESNMQPLVEKLAALNIQHSLELPEDPIIRAKYGSQARVQLDEKSWREIFLQLEGAGYTIVDIPEAM